MEQIEVGSVFSGLGGIEYGFEQAGGFKTIWNCETDPYASAILKKHWPSVPNLGNIKEVDWTSIRRPDLICGGFPCQDISNAGKRAGITGKRSGLWKEYAKAIRILRPRYVFIENVSALTGRGLNVVLADLASCGYDAEWDCIPAQAVGAPHRRDRLFIVAYTNSSRLLHRQAQEQPTKARIDAQRKSVTEGSDVPDTNSRRLAENKICTGRQVLNERGNISNTNSKRLEISENPRIFENSRKELQQFASRHRSDVSNTESKRFNRGICSNRENTNRLSKHTQEKQPVFWSKTTRCGAFRREQTNWAVEPSICRVAHGIPNRIHRIKCLGNSVVPQVAQFIAERIKKREEILR